MILPGGVCHLCSALPCPRARLRPGAPRVAAQEPSRWWKLSPWFAELWHLGDLGPAGKRASNPGDPREMSPSPRLQPLETLVAHVGALSMSPCEPGSGELLHPLATDQEPHAALEVGININCTIARILSPALKRSHEQQCLVLPGCRANQPRPNQSCRGACDLTA